MILAKTWNVLQALNSLKLRDFRLRREAYDNCAHLGCYAASSGKSLPTFRNLSIPSSRVKNRTDRLSRDVGKELQILAA
jgi:hypothetical protein